MFGSRIASTAVRVGHRRMSTAAPKMHKWAESGEALVKTRPPPGHEHVRYILLTVLKIFIFWRSL